MITQDPIETEIMRMTDREMEARDKGFCFADEPQTTKPKDAIECLMNFGVQLGAEAKSTATNSLRARQCEIRSTAIFTVLDTLTQYRKALEGFGVTFADNGFIRMIPREAEGPEAEYDLPVCESCQKTLTIHDPIAWTDGQCLLCFKCEQLERCDACEHFHEVNETCGKCGKTWSGDVVEVRG